MNVATTKRRRSVLHKLLLTLVSCFTIVSLHAQNFSLTGKITDKNDVLLSGEILVLNPADSQLVKGGVFTNGYVSIEELSLRSVILRISAEGFAEKDIPVTVPANATTHSFGTIQLTKIIKGEVAQVVARAPIFKKTEGGTRMNVENTLLSASTSATEVLSKSPGVSLSGNRAFVFGRGEALIYLNGKQITYERLASIPVNMIKDVEIITNPPAKYDARGRAVINITVKKNNKQGTQGVFTHTSTYGPYYKTQNALNLNYRKNAFSISGDYNMENGRNWNRNIYENIYQYSSGTFNTKGYNVEKEKVVNTSNYRIGIGYDINEKSDISVQYDGLYALSKLDINNNSDIFSPGNIRTIIRTHNGGQSKYHNNSVNLNFNHKIDSSATLFIGGQYSSFINKTDDEIAENIDKTGYPYYQAIRVNDGRNKIDLYIAQADYARNTKNNGKLEAGLKFAHIRNDGRISVRSREVSSSTWTEFPEYANSFVYNERVPAAYMQYSGSFSPKWNYFIGARGEFSNVEGFSNKLGKKVIDTTYFNFFPNLKLDYTASDNWVFGASYSLRINRPYYQDIDPFIWYTDSLTSTQGNPRLIPELINSYEGTASFKGYTLRLGYSVSKNTLRSVVRVGNTGPNSIIFMRDNLQKTIQYNAGLEIPVETKVWSAYNTVAVNYYDVLDNRPEFLGRPPSAQLYLYSYNQFRLGKIMNLEITGEYYSRTSNGILLSEPLYYVSASISRSFFKKKLSARLLFNDIFGSYHGVGTRTIGVVTNNYDTRNNSQYGRLTLTWRFGRLKDVNYKNKLVNEAEYNRIKQ